MLSGTTCVRKATSTFTSPLSVVELWGNEGKRCVPSVYRTAVGRRGEMWRNLRPRPLHRQLNSNSIMGVTRNHAFCKTVTKDRLMQRARGARTQGPQASGPLNSRCVIFSSREISVTRKVAIIAMYCFLRPPDAIAFPI